MKVLKPILPVIFAVHAFLLGAQVEDTVKVTPQVYERALRNPMKGFTTINVGNHPWGTLSHTYIRWNEIENHESDGIDKIINVCNEKWEGVASDNIKIIPRVYLHWDGDRKYWPADMQEDDYTSEQFRERVLRLIERLGICWDNDPRVAFVEMGIFGKWGEQHSPFPTSEMEQLVGDAFADAFNKKKVSVRRNWERFTDHPFGEYWDSWAHYDQMYTHGNSIKQLNDAGRYKEIYIGGEVAYNWGSSDIQPGATPTESVAVKEHRDFVINSIRWLHCTQLRWISDYDKFNPDAALGAEEMQKTFGYRYLLNRVEFSLSDSLTVAFDVTNTGSAPFYYDWPVEVALLDSATREPVWTSTFDSVDIRDWLPGEGWTDPEWTPSGNWSEYHPNVNWNSASEWEWTTPPAINRVVDRFKITAPEGTYILSLAVLDPAGDLPALRFATGNYLNGGRHPVGLVSVGENRCYPLPGDFQFEDPLKDNSLYYDDEFEIDYVPDPAQAPYTGSAWRFPTDTVSAWQYDYMFYEAGDKYFALDSGHTIGIYGCGDTTGQNIRSYQDSVLHGDAAQFLWDPVTETIKKNGQWLEYSAAFKINQPYQLLLRARTGNPANFNLKIYTILGDTALNRDISLEEDFENLGGGNTHTDWLLATFPTPKLWGNYIVRFNWNDHIGEPGIFGGFTFTGSAFDVTPPEWYYVSLGTFAVGTDIEAALNEPGTIFLVPEGTAGDTASIYAAALAETEVAALTLGVISTSGVTPGVYILYAVDGSGNVSEASRTITLEEDQNTHVSLHPFNTEEDISIRYDPAERSIKVICSNQLSRVTFIDILGKVHSDMEPQGNEYTFDLTGSRNGIYLVRALDADGNVNTKKITTVQR